jgi:hypothetical protein
MKNPLAALHCMRSYEKSTGKKRLSNNLGRAARSTAVNHTPIRNHQNPSHYLRSDLDVAPAVEKGGASSESPKAHVGPYPIFLLSSSQASIILRRIRSLFIISC